MATATAFGLDIDSDRPLSFLEGATAAATGRPLRIRLDRAEQPNWRTEASLISDERHLDGSVSFQIEAAEERYRIHGPAYGSSVLAADGQSAWGEPGGEGMAGWQRLLVAQVLPFAAVLQGLEVLHASAVVVDGGAVALAGPSGIGKTSLALALQRQGADLLADDVLAVQREGGELLAHPGAPIAGVDRSEAERLRASGEDDLEHLLASNERERVTRRALAPRPVPLRALFLLDRRTDFDERPGFAGPLEPQHLLGTTFNLVLASPQRLAVLLDICALMAKRQVERVSYGPETDATELAAVLRSRLDGAT
ncbi:MAG: hypothetical protein JWM24_1662 [Solirubrobacterales bacterium]|nr:hypothetical protein [Solirubrobacterales bacterium]